MNFAPLMTTSTGSFPRPNWLAVTEGSHAHTRFGGALRREAEEDATRLVLREQEEIGLDIVTDGELRRENFIYQALATWDGVDMTNKATKAIYRNRQAPRDVPRVIGKIVRRAQGAVEDVRFAKSHTQRPLKLAVVGPMTVVDSTVDAFYKDEAALAMDAAAAINAELLELQAAGCDMLQLDEPAMTRYHDKLRAYGAKALDRCLEGITVPTLVHLCYGYPLGQESQHHFTYPAVFEALLPTRIGGFTVEFARSHYDPAVLAPCRDRLVMFGCIDPGNTPPPAVDDVKALVRRALNYLDARRLMLAPDCGLVTLGRDLARQKLDVMVRAARELRREL
jgi:5-methyltetrahydropteroyltriglutamate--homocysteine methyltransferase